MLYKIPTIQEIYNQYHRQTFYIQNGMYPKPIKNFDTLWLKPNILEYIKKFQNLLSRNRDSINWRIYIQALAQNFKTRFDLRYLSNLAGIKIYRTYVQSKFEDLENETEIYNEIIRSLMFINSYLKTNNITFKEYFELDKDTISISLKHIYAGTISTYFYAAFDPYKVGFDMLVYPNDLFLEYFSMNKEEFMQKYILNKHKDILKYKKIKELIEKIYKIFK